MKSQVPPHDSVCAVDSSRRLALFVSVGVFFWSTIVGDAAQSTEKPNIVLIMADDVSWECFSSYGANDYKTPRIDELARKGVRFTHCYSTPICTTSRVQLMTGQYNFRNYTHFGYLDPQQKTFGHLLQDAGYKTAIAGKWQLNGLTNKLPGFQDATRPNKAGFDEYMLWQLTRPKALSGGGGERFWSPIFEHNGKVLSIEENRDKYGPDMLCDFVCDFMERNADEPFFVYYPMVLVHDPFVPTPDTIGSGSRGHDQNRAVKADKKKNFVAMVQYMDKIVGRIVDKLASMDELDNTLILFTADNGTNTSITSSWNGREIRGGKAGMTDMGTHVPLVAYWQGHTPAATTVDSLVDFTDFYPTLAQVAGLSLDTTDPRDGFSFHHRLVGEAGADRDWVFCHYQPYWNKKPGQFVRNQKYKLYADGRIYDIGSGDLDESKDLSENPGVANPELSLLRNVMSLAPPAPTEVGTKDTTDRPIFPDWQRIEMPR